MSSDFEGEALVPDSWEPIIAYRTFALNGRDEYLHSTGYDPDFHWEPGVNVAMCKAYGGVVLRMLDKDDDPDEPPPDHEVPGDSCTCGFYSLKSLRAVMEYFSMDRWFTGQPEHIWAKVALWGKVIEGARGYRASHAKIVELLAMPTNIVICQAIAKTYDVDVSLELLTEFSWFVGGPAHGRVMESRDTPGMIYEQPIMEAIGLPRSGKWRAEDLSMRRAVYQRDARTHLWRFRGYRRG